MLELLYSKPGGSLDSLSGEALELRGPRLILHQPGFEADGGHLDREGVLWVDRFKQERITVKVEGIPEGGPLWARGGEQGTHPVAKDAFGFFLVKHQDRDLALTASDGLVLARWSLDGPQRYWILTDGQKLNAIRITEPVPGEILLLPAEPLGVRSRLSSLAG